MELEEALALIKTLQMEVQGLKDTGKTELEDLIKTHEKDMQVSYNKGFDKAKNASKDEVKDGYIKKEDVEKMISENQEKADTALSMERTNSKVRETLLGLGAKNPNRAMKLIEEDDLKSFGTEDFDQEAFVTKYQDDIVFKKQEGEFSSNFTKNNKKAETKMSLDEYASLPKAERMAMSKEDRNALE